MSGAHGADPLAPLTNGYRSAFAVPIAVAALAAVAAAVLLGSRRDPEPTLVGEPEPAVV